MRIVSWNVNGIRAVHKKGLFEPMIEELQPDILCLQETKAEQHQSEVDLPDYDEYWNSATKKGYSGTAIFTNISPRPSGWGFPSISSRNTGLPTTATETRTPRGALSRQNIRTFSS